MGDEVSMDLNGFDGEELLHLAIKLANQQKYVEALTCLKQACRLEPSNGTLLYFMGVVYAQIDLYERGLTTMERAVQLDPTLHVAHFQIGLLYFTSNRVAQAIEAWRPLERLSDDEPLLMFKTGLEALAREDFDACRQYLREGIARNTTSQAINADMAQILERIEDRFTQDMSSASRASGLDSSLVPN
jgi:tetratricopeptide (TPR) repeat protein